MKQKVVAYYRVSTTKQGQSGLGLEAQRAAVAAYCESNNAEVLKAYTEVETGTKKRVRPVLQQALAHAKRTGSTLLIAKLDRLARNVAFIANLMEGGADFRACDMPEANKFMLHIMSAVAEHEASIIAKRTKDALAAAKARGTLLGGSNPACRNLTNEARHKGAAASGRRTATLAKEFAAEVLPMVKELHGQGKSLRAIAAALNADGHATRSGSPWSAVQVKRVLDRAA